MIAGLLGPPDLWQALEVEWMEEFAEFAVPHFHATEAENGYGNVFSRLERPLRDALRLRLANVIAKHKPTAITSAVTRTEWSKIKDSPVGQNLQTPYHLCFGWCVQKIVGWSKGALDEEPIALMFGDHQEYKLNAGELYESYKSSRFWGNALASVKFAPAAQYPALQAADLFAYELSIYEYAKWKGEDLPVRPAADAIKSGYAVFVCSVRFIQAHGEFHGTIKTNGTNPQALIVGCLSAFTTSSSDIRAGRTCSYRAKSPALGWSSGMR
jgi:hypothetical protein